MIDCPDLFIRKNLLSSRKLLRFHFLSFLLISVFYSAKSQNLCLTKDGSGVNIGDLDVGGNQLTVEALIYHENGINVVSKHTGPNNVNYLLRPITFELTTYVSGNSGPTKFLFMVNPFKIKKNQWYHIAGTYDGKSVKYYVDGCMVIDTPWTGNLVENDLITCIGNQSTNMSEQFIGKIDEVRIWNVCRTRKQILSNMMNLPNPSSQSGLLAYYKFDTSLDNNQGNFKWQGKGLGNLSFCNGNPNVQPFAIKGLEKTKTSCLYTKDGSIKIYTNRNDAQYSIDGSQYASDNKFINLKRGMHQISIKLPEGCIYDTSVLIESNQTILINNISATICDGQSYFGRTSSGTYHDTLVSYFGCDSIRILKLTVLKIQTTIRKSICKGQSSLGYNTNGTFSDTFQSYSNCDSIRTLILEIYPERRTQQYHTICSGQYFKLPGGRLVSAIGIYEDTLKSANGCDSFITTTIDQYPKIEDSIKINDIKCNGNNDGKVKLLALTGKPPYTYTIEGIGSNSSGEFSDLKAGSYTYILTDDNSCSNRGSFQITEPEALTVEIHPKYSIIEAGEEVVLKGTSNYPNSTFQWWPSDYLSCDTCETTISKPEKNIEYTLRVTISEQGVLCSAETKGEIFINSPIFIPNSITPNGDGINDTFGIYSAELKHLNSFSMMIFNRWGEKVFESSDKYSSWDGTYRGESVEEGVYGYQIDLDIILSDGTRKTYRYTGMITLLR